MDMEPDDFRALERLFVADMKLCRWCEETKPASDFYRHQMMEDGRLGKCKECCKAYGKQNRLDNLEKFKERGRLAHIRRRENGKYQAERVRYRFGLTMDEYLVIFERQGGVCAICRQHETARDTKTGTLKALSIDHCHATGVIRGLLCNKCNRGLGFFKDNPENLARAIDYLVETRRG